MNIKDGVLEKKIKNPPSPFFFIHCLKGERGILQELNVKKK